MRHTCPGGWWKGRTLNEIMKPMCLWRKETLIWKIKTEHTEMPRDLLQLKNKEHYAFVGTANRWKPPSTSQSVQAWAKSCPFQCFPLYSCALALDQIVGLQKLSMCMMKRYQSWSSRLIWIYQTKTPKKQNCYMLDYVCVCPSCIKAMSIHLWSSIKSSMIYVSHFLSPILSLQRLFFVELPAAASPLTWSQYLPVRLGIFFNLIQTWWQGKW